MFVNMRYIAISAIFWNNGECDVDDVKTAFCQLFPRRTDIYAFIKTSYFSYE